MANVQHSALTDPELHEIKGAAAATANQIPIADGAGSAPFSTASYAILPFEPPIKETGTHTQSSFSAGNTFTVTHGLQINSVDVAPKLFSIFMVCTTAELNWTVGDEVCVGAAQQSANTFAYPYVENGNTTQYKVMIGTSGVGHADKTAHTGQVITPANWDLKIYAWA